MTEKTLEQRYRRSWQLWSQACGRVLNGVQTLSKSPLHIAPHACPVYIQRARGARFWDVDGNEFLDYPLALGAVILGHAHPVVDEAVRRQMTEGFLYSLSSPKELELAERLCQIIPAAETIRLLKSGSEAMSAAVRIARAYTGRTVVAVCGYHGWHDWTAVRTARSAGIPDHCRDQVFEFAYNDIASLTELLDRHPGQIAAVALEPVGMEAPQDRFLEKVAEATRKCNAVLIFDEVITGCRLALGGAQAYFGVTPDLTAFGKAIGNGYPIAVLAGRAELMTAVADRVFISSTYGGDLLAVTAAMETLTILERDQGNQRILASGMRLKDGLNSAARAAGLAAQCKGLPHKTFMVFEDADGVPAKTIETCFRQECLRRGAFLGYGHFTSLAHSDEDIDSSVAVATEVMELIGADLKAGRLDRRLEGEAATDVFKRY